MVCAVTIGRGLREGSHGCAAVDTHHSPVPPDRPHPPDRSAERHCYCKEVLVRETMATNRCRAWCVARGDSTGTAHLPTHTHTQGITRRLLHLRCGGARRRAVRWARSARKNTQLVGREKSAPSIVHGRVTAHQPPTTNDPLAHFYPKIRPPLGVSAGRRPEGGDSQSSPVCGLTPPCHH